MVRKWARGRAAVREVSKYVPEKKWHVAQSLSEALG